MLRGCNLVNRNVLNSDSFRFTVKLFLKIKQIPLSSKLCYILQVLDLQITIKIHFRYISQNILFSKPWFYLFGLFSSIFFATPLFLLHHSPFLYYTHACFGVGCFTFTWVLFTFIDLARLLMDWKKSSV